MIKIEILKNVGSHKAGQIVKVETDEAGIPTDRFWRRRLKDDDGFCKVIRDEKKPRPTPKEKTQE